MSDAPSTSGGWQVRKLNDPTGWQGGPYTWEQLVAYVREGRVAPMDPVWHPSLPEWVPAQNVPGLYSAPVSAPQPPVTPQPAPAAQPPVMPATPAPTPTPIPQAAYGAPQPPAPPRKKRGLMIAMIALLVVLLAGGGFAAFKLLGDGGGILPGGDGIDMGAADTKLPSRSALIATDTWGEVPANQLCVVLVEGGTSADADNVAGTLGGEVVGELEFIDLYQIEFTGTDEADLVAAIETAEADPKVDYAYPNAQIEFDAEIWGVRSSTYDDPVYDGGGGAGYEAVGVDKAWTFIKAAGLDLNKVKVGVVDDGLYMPGEGAENEFEDNINIEFPDKDAGELAGAQVYKDGTTNAAGSHGTAVSTIIGGDPDNGGPTGVAGPLGKNLTISMINQFGGKYGDVESAPDANDPTKQVWYNGKTYSIGSLVAITKQIENGAKVINCSWGNSKADPKDVETYTRFFTKMAEKHPDVLFVCSGGNGGKVMDGSKRIPSGLKLDNMITVGALDKDGKTASYADKASDDYEITLGAPGTGSVVGLKPDGGGEEQDGSSFSAPHVTAAAAILKSLNPKLTAGEIKKILVDTARTSVTLNAGTDNEITTPIGAEMGGKVLALDKAVLKVINDIRAEKGQEPLTEDALEKLGVVDAVAVTGESGEYAVRGIVGAAGPKGVTLKIDVYGENFGIGGSTEQHLEGAGSAEWDVTLPENKGTIVVTRLDTQAKSVISVEQLDINGAWSGSFTITDVEITDEDLAEEEGCTVAIINELKGKPLGMTMDISVDEAGQGTAVTVITAEEDSDPSTLDVSFDGAKIVFSPSEGGGFQSMEARVYREGDTLVMSGSARSAGGGWTIKAVFTLSKPYTP